MLRKTLFTYLLILLGIHLTAQNPLRLESSEIENHLSRRSKILITGNIINFSRSLDPLLKVKLSFFTPTFRKRVSRELTIQPDGSFTHEVNENYPYREVEISIGDYYSGKFILHEGLHLSVDLGLLKIRPVYCLGEGIEFSGEDSQLTEYVNDFELYKQERKNDLHDERVALILNPDISKSEKVERLKKIYKKLASVEEQFAKKKGRQHQWYLSEDRIASMYADILFVHRGKKMNNLLYRECINFAASSVSQASVQYYDYLGKYLAVPNRLEVKLITERTLKEVIGQNISHQSLDMFLREFNKRTDRLPYDEEIYRQGDEIYLETYAPELLSAKTSFQLQKIQKLPEGKRNWVMLLTQPKNLTERKLFIQYAKEYGFPSWCLQIAESDIAEDEERISELNTLLGSREVEIPSLGTPSSKEGAFVADQDDAILMIKNIISSYPQKNIIVDIWVPWMEKCKYDLKSNPALDLALDSLPVQMVFLCNGNDVSESSWLEAIKEFPLQGDHIYMNAQLSEDVMELFQLMTFPSYLFINAEGTINPYLIKDISSLKSSSLVKEMSLSAGL